MLILLALLWAIQMFLYVAANRMAGSLLHLHSVQFGLEAKAIFLPLYILWVNQHFSISLVKGSVWPHWQKLYII